MSGERSRPEDGQQPERGLLLVRADGEDLTVLAPDPRVLVAAPIAGWLRALLLAVCVLATVLTVVLVWRIRASDSGPGALLVPVFVAGAIAGAGWPFLVYGSIGSRARARLIEGYRGLLSRRPRPRLATVTAVDFRAGESHHIEWCEVEVLQDDGTALIARTHPRPSLTDGHGRPVRQRTPQLPQFGDVVTVFTDPSGALPPLVQANHSWSDRQRRLRTP